MKKIIFSTIILGLVWTSCRKEDGETIDGPSLNDLVGPFSIVEDITASQDPINFATDGDLVFNGELSKNTTWVIQITGSQSGAVRTLTGSERILSSDNAAWNGGANSYPSFGLEDVYVEITFPDEDGSPILYDTITVTGEKVDQGVLVTSFENGVGSNWNVWQQTTVTAGIVCNSESAKGSCHYSLEGTVTWDWAIGSVAVQPDAGTFGLQASPNNLYYNMAIKPLESVGPTTSFVLLWFDEDENGDGVFDPNTEDRFTYEYWTSDTTWQQISLEYASLVNAPNGEPAETNGNGLPEPSKLISVNMFFLADQNNGNAKILFDHAIFTTNGPYNP